MSEFDSLNYAEYVSDKKAEGKLKLLKYLLIFAYVLFVVCFFLVCYISRFIPVFAVCPIFTWMLIFFTWRFVSFDVYYTFEHGHMEFGKVIKRKSGVVRKPSLKIEVQKAILVLPYEDAIRSEKYGSVRHIFDFSPNRASQNLMMIIFEKENGVEAVIFESIPKLSWLLSKFSVAAAKDS